MSQQDRRRIAIMDLEGQVGRLVTKLTRVDRRVDWSEDERAMMQRELDLKLRDLRWLKSDDPACPIEPFDNHGARIIDFTDRARIQAEMTELVRDFQGLRRLAPQQQTRSIRWESLFWHCDNVRHVYHFYKLDVPSWVVEKYGHRFAH